MPKDKVSKWRPAWAEDALIKPWIEYDPGAKLAYCTYCKKAKAKNEFVKGYIVSQLAELKVHAKSRGHLNSVTIVKDRSVFQDSKEKTLKRKEEELKEKEQLDLTQWYPHSMRASYFLARNNLPYFLMEDLSWLVKDVVKEVSGIELPDGYGSYSNDNAAREMVAIVANNIEVDTIERIKTAQYFTLTLDESTDISTS